VIAFDATNIEIKINNVIHSVPLSECDTDTRLDHSESLKEQGNKFFKTGKDDNEALLAYKQALYWVSIVDQNQSKGVRARLRANILANIRKWSQSIVSRPSPSDNSMISDLLTVKSAVHFIKKNYEKAIFSTTEALDLESSFASILKNKNNVLIRRADSFSRINEFESAKLDLDLVDEPNEGQLKKMRIISKRIRELTKKNDDKLAKGLSKMF